jgi:predicted dehydrogenase
MAGGSSTLVVGAGSIGQRHARLLTEMGAEVSVVTSRPQESQLTAYRSVEDALQSGEFSYCVIASPTTRHEHDVALLGDGGFAGRLLIEKPIFGSSSARCDLGRFAGARVNYNLRFHPAVEWLRERLRGSEAVIADVSAQSYLPDWRPERELQSTSSATRASGGGVLRDLSHELDLMLWLFGPVRAAHAVTGPAGDLGVEVETVCAAALELDRARAATLRLSYLDRRPERRLRITTSGDVLEADLLTGRCSSIEEEVELEVDWDETYRAAHRDALEDGERGCSAQEALEVVALIEQLERDSAAPGQR